MFQDGDRFIEVDFPELIARKSDVLKESAVLLPLLGESLELSAEAKTIASKLRADLVALKQEQKHRSDRKGKSGAEASISSQSEASFAFGSDAELAAQISQLSTQLHELEHEVHVKSGYDLIAGDLRDLPGLHRRLKEIGVDFSKPTLLFAECVFTCP